MLHILHYYNLYKIINSNINLKTNVNFVKNIIKKNNNKKIFKNK